MIEISRHPFFSGQNTEIFQRNRVVVIDQHLLGLLPDMASNTGGQDVARYLLGVVLDQATDRNNRALGRGDDVPDSDLRGLSRKEISTARPPSADEKTGLEQLVEDLFQVSLRNLLSFGDVFDLRRLSAAMIREVEQGTDAIPACGGNTHRISPKKDRSYGEQ